MVVQTPTRDEEKSKTSVTQDVCNHYWVIASAAGATSKGICRFCGAQKEFRNYLSDCLEVDEDKYQEWLGRQKDGRGNKPSGVGGAKDAVKAGT